MPVRLFRRRHQIAMPPRRFQGIEDRYMALYGRVDWTSNNMDLQIHFAPEFDSVLKNALLQRLQSILLAETTGDIELLRETAVFDKDQVNFVSDASVTVDQLIAPRLGLYFDVSQTGVVRVIWNHMQTDGVGMWRTLRQLFDPNPAFVAFAGVRIPPRIVPEVLAIPSVARRMAWRGRLKKDLVIGTELNKSIYAWSTDQVKVLRTQLGRVSFNLLTSAMVVQSVFETHPERDRLTIGLTVYFPFLNSRNKYAVLLCKVKRGSLESICAQLRTQSKSQMVVWGQAALQNFALKSLPDHFFMKTVAYFRRQIDVLISNLPVGRKPASIGGVPTLISCHPREMTIPYYFLLVGTGREINVSVTSKFERSLVLDRDFLLT